MSQIAATYGKTLVVLKCNNSRIDELKNDNIEFLRPADLGLKENFYDHEAVNCIKSLDMIMPGLRRIVVRGLAVAELLLAGDVFPYRTVMYLNDFVELANGRYDISPAKAERVRNVLRGGDLFLVQTPELARVMRGLADEDFAFELMPPPVPDTMPRCRKRKAPDPHTGTISIGYSGKIARGWGIDTLLDWTARIRRTGINVALTIIAGKINLPKKEADMFLKRVREAQVDFYQALPQKEVHALMSGMDFSWCYRDAELEDTAVEVSSKLLEGVAMGLRCLCYPNHINKRVLGSRYPFFLSTYAEFEHLLLHVRRYNGTALANRILSTYSQSAVAASLDKIRLRGSTISKSICFAGEQLGELRRYASFLKAKGHRVVLDIWQDNGTSDARWSEQCLHANETVVCVWGKCAVWYAARKDGARKLCVLVPAGTDLREDPKAKLVIWEHVEKIIFSSEQARDSFLDDFKGYQGETYVIDAAAPFIERMEEALQPDSPFPARIREKRHD